MRREFIGVGLATSMSEAFRIADVTNPNLGGQGLPQAGLIYPAASAGCASGADAAREAWRVWRSTNEPRLLATVGHSEQSGGALRSWRACRTNAMVP